MKLKSLRLKQPEQNDEVSVGYQPKPRLNKVTFLLVFGVLLVSASFYEGTAYQHSADTNLSATTFAVSGPMNAYNSDTRTDSYVRTHVLGEVTGITNSSITVQDENSGENLSLKLTGSTQVEANGQSIKASQIQVGDIVIVTKTSANSSTADKIILSQGVWNGSGTSGSNTNQSVPSLPFQSLESN